MIGAVCAIDREPRRWTPEELALLEGLAPSVMTEIEIHAPALLL